ncbi:MAG: DedA family protein [Chloroflexia bacterium]|nr:DedA family protein [Chloroflexia bacterium]
MGVLSEIGALVTAIVERMGYAGIAILLALEHVFPPIPSEAILPLAGFFSGQGRFWLPATILAATIGSTAGALVLYAIAARLGEARVQRVVRAHGRWIRLSEDDLDRADGWFDRHGSLAALIGPLIPLVRGDVVIPAGFRDITAVRFAVLTTVGSLVWNSALIGLGWYLGDRWQVVGRYATYLTYAAGIALLALLVRYAWRRRST